MDNHPFFVGKSMLKSTQIMGHLSHSSVSYLRKLTESEASGVIRSSSVACWKIMAHPTFIATMSDDFPMISA